MQEKIVAYYLRISDEDFDTKNNLLKEESASISTQRLLINQFIQSHKEFEHLEIKEFLDDGYSGTNFERPSIQKLFGMMLKGKIGCIIVKDLSRLGRNYIETGHYIEQIFPFLGVRFISLNDNFDSAQYTGNTPGIDIAFKNIIHDYYSKDLSAKVKSIKRLQQNRGEFVASKPPYGYIISSKDRHKLEIDKESAEIVKLIFSLTLDGLKPAEIAHRLNEKMILTPAQRLYKLYGFKCGKLSKEELQAQFWKPVQITKILQNETVMGSTVNNRVQVKEVGSRKLKRQKKENFIIVKNTHKAIIDEATFLKAANMIQARKPHISQKRKKHENLFYQKIYCGNCECKLKHEVKLYNKNIQAIYYCPYSRPPSSSCQLKRIKDNVIKHIILAFLQIQMQLIIDNEIHLPKSSHQKLQEKLNLIGHQIEQIKGQIPNLYEKYRSGTVSRDNFIKQKEEIASIRQKLDWERCDLEKELILMKSNEKEFELTHILEKTKMETLTQTIVNEFVEKIIVYSSNSIIIHWKWEDAYTKYTSTN